MYFPFAIVLLTKFTDGKGTMNKRITTAMMLGLILCLFQIENFAQTQPSPTTQHIDTTEEQPTSVEEKEEEEQAMLTVEEQSHSHT